jgi:hypothetical protein
MLHVFFGHDERAEAGTHAFLQSMIARASQPVAVTAITRRATEDQPEGTNAFTFRRFLVPWMLSWEGWALFVDGSDMLCRADICEIQNLANPYMAVQVVKHEYTSRWPRKYVGTAMEAENKDYERKQWASVMLINCSHFAWRQVTPDFVRRAAPLDLLQLRFISDDRIGDLPAEWNWLVDEAGHNADAKLLHFTAGIPAFEAHADAPMANEWTAALLAASTCTAGVRA